MPNLDGRRHPGVYIVSVFSKYRAQPPDIDELEACGLDFDLKDIVTALRERVTARLWYIAALEAEGSSAVRDLCEEVVMTPEASEVWLTGEDFVTLAEQIESTGMCSCLAFPPESDTAGMRHALTTLELFPQSKADLALVAMDGTAFEVFTKAPSDVERLWQQFAGMRREDPSRYF